MRNMALRGLAVVALISICFAQEKTPEGEVTGTVYDSWARQPLKGARVVLVRAGAGGAFDPGKSRMEIDPATSMNPSAEVFSTLTDASGAFRIRTTAPARFLLFASREGYVPLGDGIDPSRIIEVGGATPSKSADIQLDPIGSISGTVFDGPTGKPVKGYEIVPLKWYTGEGSRALIPAGDGAQTDARGNYVLAGLTPGEYVLRGRPNSQIKFRVPKMETRLPERRGYIRSYYPGVEERGQALTVRLMPGASVQKMDFKIEQARTASIRGRIIQNDQPAPGGLTVDITEVERQGNVSSYSQAGKVTLEPGATEFQFDYLPAGTYMVMANNRSYAFGASHAFALISVTDQNMDSIDLILRKGVEVQGTVKPDESLKMPALPQGGAPIRVFLSPRDRMAFLGERGATVDTASGAFVIGNRLVGTYDLTVGGLPKMLAVCNVSYNGSKSDGRAVTLSDGAAGHRIDLTVCAATASVAVTAKQGTKPRPDAQFILLPESVNPLIPFKDARTLMADSDGRGLFANLLPGQYRIVAVPKGAAWRTDPAIASRIAKSEPIMVVTGSFKTYDLIVED